MAKAKTLCAFKKNYLKENLSKYKKLVRDARFLCKKCGRTAQDEKRLCKPVELDS
jgi:transposase-like protein